MHIRLRPHPAVLTQPTLQSTILLHLDSDRFYELNQTAARFWEMLGSSRSLLEIQACLLDDYNVDEQRLAEEIESIVTMFREENLVVIDE